MVFVDLVRKDPLADMLAGRLAVHLPSASEGIVACAIELEMSCKCDKGI